MSRVQTLEIIDIPVERIMPSPYQPRIDFDLEELRGSIIKYGIIDPLKVRKVGDRWELVDGERRWRIAKQEGIKSVPCIVSEYSDEEADALAWRFNTERKEYSLEERAKHFRKHQEEGMSGAAIGRIHGYSRQQVNRLLAIFRLPEKYQNYLWIGEFAYKKYQYLYLKGLISFEGGTLVPDVIGIIDEAIERRLVQREFENVVDDYMSDLERRQVEEARKAATQLEASKNREEKAREALGEPEVKEPETSEELEEAAKALMEEAKRRKTPEQILEEKREKVKGSLLTGKGNAVSRIEKAKELGIDTEWMEEELEKIKNKMSFSPDDALLDSKGLKKQVNELIKRFQEGQREAELREKLTREAREKAEEDLLKDEDFLRKAAELAPIDERPVKEAPLIASMPEEFEAVRERLNETQEWIRTTLERPEVKERGKLFRNWLAHTTLHEAVHSASCPECGADWTKLRWECHGFNIEESFEKASDAYQESMKGVKT